MAIGLALLVWILGKPLLVRWRRRRQSVTPFPSEWRQILEQEMPLYRRLPVNLQRQLQACIQIFLREKRFVGCQGFTITETVRLLIAAQACLLVLNRPAGLFDSLTEILVYPDEFLVDRDEQDEAGVVSRHANVLSGESWADSQVVLSWADVLEGARDDRDGYNVVIHEFAHQLDQRTGASIGAPQPIDARQANRWSQVLEAEFARLRTDLDAGFETLLDEYGAEDPVEFFAVASETFFERPERLHRDHPELYQVLRDYYCVDPLSWQAGEDAHE